MSEDVRVQCRCGAFHEPDDPCPACGTTPAVREYLKARNLGTTTDGEFRTLQIQIGEKIYSGHQATTQDVLFLLGWSEAVSRMFRSERNVHHAERIRLVEAIESMRASEDPVFDLNRRLRREAEDERDRLRAVVGGCPRCAARVALTPESLGEHEQYPMLRELVADDDSAEVPAVVVRELFAERDQLLEEVTTLGIQSMESEGQYHDVVDERDRLRAVVDATTAWLRQMTDSACAVDVLRVADLYRTVTVGLDENPGEATG